MIYDLIALILITSSTWVYLDASGKEIGKHSDQKGFFNMSAGGWGASVLLFWLLAFPAYLVKRSDLIAEAQKHPVQSFESRHPCCFRLTVDDAPGIVRLMIIQFKPWVRQPLAHPGSRLLTDQETKADWNS